MDATLITDEYMRDALASTKPFTVVILRKGPNYDAQSPLMWEHGRRNFELRADGRLVIVCPVRDESDVTGIGIFAVSPEATTTVMSGDPAVMAGIFTFEIHQSRSFPGDQLPDY